ncbi:MAG: hypothetical protein HY736_18680 [Verrucomicrobia bacterium]|nr:hypothetical protein [Verrucomicrobiota bacterium]
MQVPTYTDITGLAGIAVALAAPLFAFPGVRRLAGLRPALLLAAVAVIVLTPLETLSVAACVRGATGDLSITTLVLLGSVSLRCVTGWPPVDRRARLALLAFVPVAALALYPMALGLGSFDPYRLGYGSPWLMGALFATALAAWFSRLDLVATCIALATLAWTLRWYESNNLWDYLLDPLVSFYALGDLALRGAKRIRPWFRGRHHAAGHERPRGCQL